MLRAVEQRIKQSTHNTDLYSSQNKLLILVGDLAQLHVICIRKFKFLDIICKACYSTRGVH